MMRSELSVNRFTWRHLRPLVRDRDSWTAIARLEIDIHAILAAGFNISTRISTVRLCALSRGLTLFAYSRHLPHLKITSIGP